jgi:hypothetical protein
MSNYNFFIKLIEIFETLIIIYALPICQHLSQFWSVNIVTFYIEFLPSIIMDILYYNYTLITLLTLTDLDFSEILETFVFLFVLSIKLKKLIIYIKDLCRKMSNYNFFIKLIKIFETLIIIYALFIFQIWTVNIVKFYIEILPSIIIDILYYNNTSCCALMTLTDLDFPKILNISVFLFVLSIKLIKLIIYIKDLCKPSIQNSTSGDNFVSDNGVSKNMDNDKKE